MKTSMPTNPKHGVTAAIPILTIAALLLASVPIGRAEPERPRNAARVFPSNSNPYGKSFGQWNAAWWQWAVSIPTSINPIVDQTGAEAGINQSGPVWFLAGNFGGVTERSATIPLGKALLFPILNNVYVSCCGDPPWDQPYTDTTTSPPTSYPSFAAYVRIAINKAGMDAVTGMTCEIDGAAVPNINSYRCPSPDFFIKLPADNLFGIDAGTYGPGAADGHYLMVRPLPPGRHTIHFSGAHANDPFSLDVTYHLIIK